MSFALMLASLLQTAESSSAAFEERHFPDMPSQSACTFASTATEVRSLAQLPKKVNMELARFFEARGGVADAGGEFNSTDLIDDETVPRVRFIRAYLTDDVWFVWWEAGGMVRQHYTLALTRRHDEGEDASAFRVAPGSIFTGDLCAGSRAFLTGARSASGF